jgi:hypothetical protein
MAETFIAVLLALLVRDVVRSWAKRLLAYRLTYRPSGPTPLKARVAQFVAGD